MLKKSFFFGCLLFGMACSSIHKTVDKSPKSVQPMVLTAILELQSGRQGQETKVKLMNIIKAGGHAKLVPDQPANFEFRFVDSQSHTVNSIFKQISLTKVYEYADEQGVLRKKVLDGEPIVVPVRVNYQPEMEKLVVYQMMKENYEPIATFLLQEKTK